MRIHSINIKNYRQYESLLFKFPESKTSDIHIIVAQNGVGKTNLLNAITWCLYSKEPHLGDEDKNKGLPIINLSALKKARSAGKDTETVEVEIRAQDGDQFLTYKRILPFKVSGAKPFEEISKEKFTVISATSAGDPKVYDGEEALNFVNRYMPEKVREYFYFDGEQLGNYFTSRRRGQVRSAIFDISQVDVVHRIYERLGEAIKNLQKEAGAKTPDIKNITDEIDSADNQLDTINQRIVDLDDQIAKSDNIINENTEYLQGEENLPELEKQFQSYKTQKEKLEYEKRELMDSLYSFVREMKVAFAFYKTARNSLDLITKKEDEKALPPNIDKDLLQRALNEHICTICNQQLSDHEEVHIQKLLDTFQVSSATSNILMSIRSELERIVNSVTQYPEAKRQINDRYLNLVEQISKVDNALSDVDSRINRVGNKEEVRLKHQEREDHIGLKKQNTERLGVAKVQKTEVEGKIGELKEALNKALAKDKECAKLRQYISFADRSRDIVGGVEKDMMDEVRRKMETRTTQYFNMFIWKKNTYDHIELDKDFQLDLKHKDGYSCVGTTSAAERALLALSFTLALHEVSGFNSLLFIDTPVARVSGANRINFANILCEVGKGKQLIMTFTQDEYAPDIKKLFDPAAKTYVELGLQNEEIAIIKVGG